MLLRDYAPSQRKCTFGIDNKTRFRLQARLKDQIVWRGFFDDQEDADAFLYALARHRELDERMPREIIRLTAKGERWPEWSDALTASNVSYEFHSLTFLTANPGQLDIWRAPQDWINPGDMPEWFMVGPLYPGVGSPGTFANTTYSDWNNAINTLEAIAGGGGGGGQNASRNAASAGAGGAYGKSNNVTLSGGVLYYNPGIAGTAGGSGANGGAGGDSFARAENTNAFPTAGAQAVGAKGGAAGLTNSNVAVAGGAATAGYGGNGSFSVNPGAPYAYKGGDAGGCTTLTNGYASGGAGAGGPNGAGGNGGINQDTPAGEGGGGGGGGANGGHASGTTGGTGGNGNSGATGGSGGTVGNSGSAGTPANGSSGAGGGGGGTGATNGGAGSIGREWDSTHGSGAGGGALGYGGTSHSGAGGLYGAAGGSGGDGAFASTSGAGAQGLIVVTYTPASTQTLNFGPQWDDGSFRTDIVSYH